MRRALVVGLVALVASLLSIGLIVAEPVGAAEPGAEEQFLRLLNEERAAHGLRYVVHDDSLQTVARQWADHLAATQRLAHRGNLVAAVEAAVGPEWSVVGENVGRGLSVDELHTAFMNSPTHRANVLGDFNRAAVGVTVDSEGETFVAVNFLRGAERCARTGREVAAEDAAWAVGARGEVYTSGSAPFHGSAGSLALRAPVTGAAAPPDGGGYWLAGADGGVLTFGGIGYYGSMGGIPLRAEVVGILPSARGYSLIGADGGVFTFGDAPFRGSLGGVRLASSIVAGAPTVTGNGYWLVSEDGGVFSFGDAGFYGSLGNEPGHAPIESIVPTSTGGGYWLVGRDGGVFAFGDAPFHGSAAATPVLRPIVSATNFEDGYSLVDVEGRRYVFSARLTGMTLPQCSPSPVVAVVSADRRIAGR